MTHYYIGADSCGAGEMAAMKTIAKELRKCGHKVDIGTVTPEQEAAGYHVSKKKVFLFLVCGVAPATMWSFKVAIAKGAVPPTIFLHGSWANKKSSSPMRSESKMLNYSFVPEWDSGGFVNTGAMKRDAGSAKTVEAYVNKYSKYIGVAWASSPTEMGKKLCNGQVTGYGHSDSSSAGGLGGSSGSGGGYTGSSSSSNESDSNVSPLLQGEMTFEELVGEICNGIDLLFLTKRSVVVVDDFSSIYAQAKYLRDKGSYIVKGEDIKLWELEEDSYELEVNQHGFYNTVYVEYKNGVVKESYDEFVRVYGEIPITYKDPKINKTTAIMKAKSYLAAHVRDFGMTVNLSMLNNGDIDIGDIVTVENPQTLTNQIRKSKNRDPEYLFVDGVTTDWEGEGYITTDLELQFAPVSPTNPEVPFSGTATGSSNSS